jgi:2-methylcitrate dehydratase PrpD
MTSASLDRTVGAAAGLDLDRVPASVLAHTGRTVADTVAVIRAGTREPQLVRLLGLLAEQGLVGPADQASARTRSPVVRSASVLSGPVHHAAPGQAAFLNATAGTFLELDEGMRPTGHPAMHVVPAALAAAQNRHATGAELLRAVLAGYEVTARLFQAVRLTYPVHPHGHFGAVGAAVAVALLTDVDPVQAARIAGTTPLLPVWDACFDGATARNTYIGLAAQSGVMAADLARAGFTGSESALMVAYGQIGGEIVHPEALDAPLDYDNLGVTRNYFKRHSACALTHAALDAVAGMDVPSVRLIRSVWVETVKNNMKLDRQPRPNDLSGRFSLPYSVATALSLGRTDPEAFRYRPEVAELAKLVEISAAPDLEAEWPDASPARVTVEWDGGSQTSTVRNPRGHWTQPLSPEELREKFVALVDDVGVADTWWARLTDLPSVDDSADLFASGAE